MRHLVNVTGPCAVCERHVPDLRTCSLCGQNVCGEHWSEQDRICSRCAARGRHRHVPQPPGQPPARDLAPSPEPDPPSRSGGDVLT